MSKPAFKPTEQNLCDVGRIVFGLSPALILQRLAELPRIAERDVALDRPDVAPVELFLALSRKLTQVPLEDRLGQAGRLLGQEFATSIGELLALDYGDLMQMLELAANGMLQFAQPSPTPPPAKRH
jgi:hypothetical protein